MSEPIQNSPTATIFIVDDDPAVRDSLSQIVRAVGFEVRLFESAEQFLREFRPGHAGCLVLDVRMSGMDGITLYEKLVAHEINIPTIVITGHGDVSMSVRAMKSGVVDFLEKPCQPEKLIDSIRVAISLDARNRKERQQQAASEELKSQLTKDELAVMEQICAGRTNKEIGVDLDVSLRTVQFRRASIMKKLGVESRADLVEVAQNAGWKSFASSDELSQQAGFRHLSVHASKSNPAKMHSLDRSTQPSSTSPQNRVN